jgi:hypothetical protein
MVRTCPSCGAPAKPGEKFCGHCGSPLELELPGEGAGQPVPPTAARGLKTKILMIGVVLIIVVLAIVAGYFFMKGPGSAAPATANQSGAAGSYVIVETEVPVTTLPATVMPVTNTTLPTKIPTTVATMRVAICPADRRLCANNCTDVRIDNKNCGSCGNICPAGQSCSNGNCMMSCTSDKTACPEGCFNLNIDNDHCGTCGNNCPAGLICSNGQCAPPPTSYIITSL